MLTKYRQIIFVLKLLVLICLDYILIKYFVDHNSIRKDTTIYIIFLVPMIFMLNFIIGFVFLLFKKINYYNMFLINAFISSLLMIFLFFNKINETNDLNFLNQYHIGI
jgi:hypothetical protein